jgi:hypothetical protein
MQTETAEFHAIHVHSMPFSITQCEQLASVLRTAEEGDCTALLSGADAPFVLRSVGTGYHLTGICYLHGVMSGKLWPQDEFELKTVLLCSICFHGAWRWLSLTYAILQMNLACLFNKITKTLDVESCS